MRRTLIGMTALAASLCVAAPAAAGTLTLEGDTYVYTAAPGETNYLHVGGNDDPEGELYVHDEPAAIDISAPDCPREAWADATVARCPRRSGIGLALGGAKDRLYVRDPLPAGYVMTADGGDG